MFFFTYVTEQITVRNTVEKRILGHELIDISGKPTKPETEPKPAAKKEKKPPKPKKEKKDKSRAAPSPKKVRKSEQPAKKHKGEASWVELW